MTRYTYVLLVCRSVGVLALLPLAKFACQLLPAFELTRAIAGKGATAFSGPGYLALALGIGIPIAAGVCGLKADKIARCLGGEGGQDPVRIRFSATIAIFIIALLGLPICRDLALAGFIKTRMGPDTSWADGSFGDLVIERLEANFREIWQLVFEVTALLATVAVILKLGLNAQGLRGQRGR